MTDKQEKALKAWQAKERAKAKRHGDYDTWARKCMKECGFFVHFVGSNEPCADCGEEHDHTTATWPDHLANIHTHGFEQTWKHPDFQIVLAMPPQVAQSIFWKFADQVRAGKRFEAGKDYADVIEPGPNAKKSSYSVRLAWAEENDRQVLRVLIPDPEGRLPGDQGCEQHYLDQLNFDTD